MSETLSGRITRLEEMDPIQHGEGLGVRATVQLDGMGGVRFQAEIEAPKGSNLADELGRAAVGYGIVFTVESIEGRVL